MQTKGGGKHDILSVGRATATTPECLWMRLRDPDADMCPTPPGVGKHGGVHGASELRSVSGAFHQPIELQRSRSRDVAGLGMIKQRRSSWRGSSATIAQLGGQDKSHEVRRGRLAEKRRHIRHAARGATTHDSLLIHPTHVHTANLCTSPRGDESETFQKT